MSFERFSLFRGRKYLASLSIAAIFRSATISSSSSEALRKSSRNKQKRVRKEREKDRAFQFSDAFTMREEESFLVGEREKGRKEKRVRKE